MVRVWSRLSSAVARLKLRAPQVMCDGPNAAKLEKHRGVLVAMIGDGTLGWSTEVSESQGGKVAH